MTAPAMIVQRVVWILKMVFQNTGSVLKRLRGPARKEVDSMNDGLFQ